MPRRFVSGIATVIMAVASSVAPFVHFHPEDRGHHHAANGLTHVHFPVVHLEAPGPKITLPVPDQVYLNWLPVAAERVHVVPSLTSTPFSLQPTFVSFGWAPELEQRSHSPPPLRLRPARAPPV